MHWYVIRILVLLIMILIFTGNGKGKTTAALGQAMRALGDDERVLIIQFIKGPFKSGEDFFASKFGILNSKFCIIKGGLGFVGILGDKLPFEEHRISAQKTWELAKQEISSGLPGQGKWDLVVLDEINNALHLELLSIDEISDFLKDFKNKSEKPDIILTGRDASAELIELADLVTEMREVKHPYAKGGEAKRGIEY